jgi:surface carbohydrate biosynthesis protein
MSKKNLLIVPIEIKVREFIHKLFLSFHVIANTNFRIIIGGQRFITNKIRVHNSIWLDKNTYAVDREKTPVHLDGNKIIMLDEEGPISFFDKVTLKERYSRSIKNQVDYFLFNGIKDIKKINKKFLFKKKYFIMGNPKFDLVKNSCNKIHFKEINLIKKKYNKFLFITGHFSMSQLEPNNVKKSLESANAYSLSSFNSKMKIISKIKKNYLSLINLTKKIATQNKELTVIFRKHPTENDKSIRKLFGKIPNNLKLIYKYSVTPWLFACEYHLHSGCQTSLESAVLKKKIITYLPNYDEAFSNYKCFSPFFYDEEKCLYFFKNISNKKKNFFNYKGLRQISANIEKKFFFYKKFIKLIKSEFSNLNSYYVYKKNYENSHVKKILLNILSNIKNIIIGFYFFRKLLPYNILISKEAKLAKFRSLKKSEITYYLEILSKIYNYKIDFVVKKVSLNVFEIYKKEKVLY